MDIAATIRRAREALGLSQTELAKRIGVSKTAVSKWEDGTSAPKRKRAAAVARVLGLSERELLAHANVGLTLVDDETSGRMIPIMRLSDVPETGVPMEAAESARFPRVLADVADNTHAVALKVDSVDMQGDVDDGDVVIVAKNVVPRADDLVVAVVDHEIMLRRYKPRGTDTSGHAVFDLTSPNPDIATRTVNATHPGRVLGVVIEHRRRRAP